MFAVCELNYEYADVARRRHHQSTERFSVALRATILMCPKLRHSVNNKKQLLSKLFFHFSARDTAVFNCVMQESSVDCRSVHAIFGECLRRRGRMDEIRFARIALLP